MSSELKFKQTLARHRRIALWWALALHLAAAAFATYQGGWSYLWKKDAPAEIRHTATAPQP